jgi:hypothetical protein
VIVRVVMVRMVMRGSLMPYMPASWMVDMRFFRLVYVSLLFRVDLMRFV